jgi:uncharacterized membrane protein YbjE (DUF340 family)
VSFDPLLYVALGVGFAVGRATSWRSPRIGQAALVTVAVLLFLLGDALGLLPGGTLLSQIPLAVAFAAATLVVTLLVVRLISRTPPAPPGAVIPPPLRTTLLTPAGFLVALLVGVAVGKLGGVGPGSGTEYALYVLLALVGFDLELDRARLRSAGVPILAAVTGALVIAVVFTATRLVPASAAFATAFAFGWYSLAGPLAAVRLGPALGLFAFLANFLRENFTMLSAPVLGRRVRGEGLAAMGGATSMDTTLYFVTRYGDAKAATVALATGVVLTTLAGVLLPVLLSVT